MVQRLTLLIAFFCHLAQANHPFDCSEQIEYYAVMDPYGSGRLLGPEIQKRGYQRLAVLSSNQVPTGYSFYPHEWDRVVVYTNPEDTARAMLEGDSKLVGFIDGAESGTVKGSFTRDALRPLGTSLLGSNSHLAWARRDKQILGTVLGDLYPRFYATTTLAEALEAARKIGYPVIVKPNRNAGGAKVRRCYTPNDVTEAFSAIPLGTSNVMLETDTAVLIQEPVLGKERAFNGLRDSHGNVIFTGIWNYSRELRNGSNMYLKDTLVDPKAEDLEYLLGRAELAVHRLEHVGPFHIEMIEDKIIDFGARLSGGGLPLLESVGGSYNPFQLALDVGFYPNALCGLPRLYTFKKFVGTTFISTPGGKRASHRLRPQLEQLKDEGKLLDYSFFFPERTLLEPTVDSDTVVAEMLIQADSDEAREALVTKFLEWRDEGKFEE